ncbi:hypothetical protein SHKM778_15950 [Streptomyces sp. KM77-8]|uniref:Acyl-CoA carboxylase subunit epsilon n=1 Tax=Streptomyces haneummycinicus TaxID=3074435 RepID=A0AAT9HDC8_9ACTN
MSTAEDDDSGTGGDIAVVGHADLAPDTLPLVEFALRTRLARWLAPVRAMVRTGAGTPWRSAGPRGRRDGRWRW